MKSLKVWKTKSKELYLAGTRAFHYFSLCNSQARRGAARLGTSRLAAEFMFTPLNEMLTLAFAGPCFSTVFLIPFLFRPGATSDCFITGFFSDVTNISIKDNQATVCSFSF